MPNHCWAYNTCYQLESPYLMYPLEISFASQRGIISKAGSPSRPAIYCASKRDILHEGCNNVHTGRNRARCVDASVRPCDGSVVVCSFGGEFQLRRYRLYPSAHFEHLSGDGRKGRIDPEWADENVGILGVFTHVVNDMRTMEFYDCPVM